MSKSFCQALADADAMGVMHHRIKMDFKKRINKQEVLPLIIVFGTMA
jgi:hypothetical protein